MRSWAKSVARSSRQARRATVDLAEEPKAPEIRKVGVLGCGLMGSGIAQVTATSGYTTIVREVDAAPLAKGRGSIEKSAAKLVDKGKLTAAEREAALARLTFTTELAALSDCDLVIEAVTEDLELKNQLWRELDDKCPR